MSEYECPKCKQVYSGTQFSERKFCTKCGMFLQPKYVKTGRGVSQGKRASEIETLEITRDQVNVKTLFEEFMRLKDFSCGEGIIYNDVQTWISERKRAYVEFQIKFRELEMNDLRALHDNFKDFLHFKNNKSWTTLYRSGMKALCRLDSVKRLITFLQNESIPVPERINQSLRGKYHVEGIGIGIITGLLHTLHPAKYGVWNSRTVDTLDIIKRKPILSSNIGHSYLLINDELQLLERELCTDLTTIDGFMWYVSKRIKILT